VEETIYISDLIKTLEEIKNNHGDIEVLGSFSEPIEDIANILSIKTLNGNDEYLEIG